MKIRELIESEGFDEKQRRTVLRTYSESGIPDIELDLDPSVDPCVLKFLKAISNPLRFQILKILRKGWLCVCVISALLERDQTLISHHIRTLKEANLLLEKRVGKMHFYRLNTDEFDFCMERLRGEFA